MLRVDTDFTAKLIASGIISERKDEDQIVLVGEEYITTVRPSILQDPMQQDIKILSQCRYRAKHANSS